MARTLTLLMVYKNVEAWKRQLEEYGADKPASHSHNISAFQMGCILKSIEDIGAQVPDTWGYLAGEAEMEACIGCGGAVLDDAHAFYGDGDDVYCGVACYQDCERESDAAQANEDARNGGRLSVAGREEG